LDNLTSVTEDGVRMGLLLDFSVEYIARMDAHLLCIHVLNALVDLFERIVDSEEGLLDASLPIPNQKTDNR